MTGFNTTVATKKTAAENVTLLPAVIEGIYFVDTAGGVAGRIELTTGSSGGETQLDLDTPGNGEAVAMSFQNGIPCPGGISVNTLTNVDSVTVFWRRA